ncbi:hypothetical protein R6Q57_018391 [Mikania cordata]
MLADYVGDEHVIICNSPDGMYAETYEEGLSYVELLQLFCNDWLDITIIHLFAMSFFGLPNSKSAIFNPNEISGDKCVKSPDRVKEHLLDVYSFHSEKTFFLASYIASGHWVLFIVHPLKQHGYIVDSINKHKSNQNYAFTYLVEEAFVIKFKWEVVKCVQQRNTWECGFCVVKHIVYNKETRGNAIWNEKKYITSKEIDGMIINLAP